MMHLTIHSVRCGWGLVLIYYERKVPLAGWCWFGVSEKYCWLVAANRVIKIQDAWTYLFLFYFLFFFTAMLYSNQYYMRLLLCSATKLPMDSNPTPINTMKV